MRSFLTGQIHQHMMFKEAKMELLFEIFKEEEERVGMLIDQV